MCICLVQVILDKYIYPVDCWVVGIMLCLPTMKIPFLSFRSNFGPTFNFVLYFGRARARARVQAILEYEINLLNMQFFSLPLSTFVPLFLRSIHPFTFSTLFHSYLLLNELILDLFFDVFIY